MVSGVYRAHGVVKVTRWVAVTTLINAAFADLQPVLRLHRDDRCRLRGSPLKGHAQIGHDRALVHSGARDRGPVPIQSNPDYICQVLVYAGFGIVANRLWPLILSPGCLVFVTNGVIEREERSLGRRFGTAYREYAQACALVRSWSGASPGRQRRSRRCGALTKAPPTPQLAMITRDSEADDAVQDNCSGPCGE
jgi:hypothetical protein